MLFSQEFIFKRKSMPLCLAERQPFGQEHIDFPFVVQAGMVVIGLDGQYMLPETDDFDLMRIVIDTQQRIRIGKLPFFVGEVIGQMNNTGVGRLFQYLEIEIHVPRTAGSVQAPQVL